MSCRSDPYQRELPLDEQTAGDRRPLYAWTDLTYLLYTHGISWGYYVITGTAAGLL